MNHPPSESFNPFPKIARLSREIIVTEKIDGTNAQIYIPDNPQCACAFVRREYQHTAIDHETGKCKVYVAGEPCMRECGCSDFRPQRIFAGSRTKWITPQDDNHGFAKWVEANQEALLKLGPGYHFGEWWGSGIQRGYGLTKGEKRFSLFNVSRWGPGGKDEALKPECCSVVPTLWRGNFDEFMGDALEIGSTVSGDPIYISPMAKLLEDLRTKGSVAAPGFVKPEGVVIFHTAGGYLFKKTIEKDEQPKGANR